MALTHEIPKADPTVELDSALLDGRAILAVSIIPLENEDALLAAGLIEQMGGSRLFYPEALEEEGWEINLMGNMGRAYKYRYARIERGRE